ncbi:ANPRA protein, partial [Polypterus senegalus]
MLLYSSVGKLSAATCSGVAKNITLAIVLPRYNTAYPWAWPRVGPAIDLAIKRINHDPNLLPGYSLCYVFESSEDDSGYCSDSIAPLVAIDLKFTHNPSAFIGPGCHYTCAPVGRFTSHWKVPMITAGASAYGFQEQKTTYSFLTRTGPTAKKLGEFAVHVHRFFSWTKQALMIYDDKKSDNRHCYFTTEGLFYELQKDNITLIHLPFQENAEDLDYQQLVQMIRMTGRKTTMQAGIAFLLPKRGEGGKEGKNELKKGKEEEIWRHFPRTVQTKNLTLAVVLPRYNTAYPWAWPRVGPAIDLAFEKINQDPNLLRGYILHYVFESSEDDTGNCSDSIAPLVAVDLKFAHNPSAFIGPGCDYTSAPVARFTSHWKVPLITAAASANGFYQQKTTYSFMTRTGPTQNKLGEFLIHLHQFFNWNRHALLVYVDEKIDDRPCYFVAEGVYEQLKTVNISVLDTVFQEKEGNVDFHHLLQQIKSKGRSE